MEANKKAKELVGRMEENSYACCVKDPSADEVFTMCIHKAKSLINQQGEETCDAMGHFGGTKPEGICDKCNKKW